MTNRDDLGGSLREDDTYMAIYELLYLLTMLGIRSSDYNWMGKSIIDMEKRMGRYE
jgi:hypothetical protein